MNRAQFQASLSRFATPLVGSVPVIDMSGNTFPPFNIERYDDDLYRITVGVAGYANDDLEVSEEGSHLVVRGVSRLLRTNAQIVYRTIEPAFERRFQLLSGFRLDEWKVLNGLLLIDIARDPPMFATMDAPLDHAARQFLEAPA